MGEAEFPNRSAEGGLRKTDHFVGRRQRARGRHAGSTRAEDLLSTAGAIGGRRGFRPRGALGPGSDGMSEHPTLEGLWKGGPDGRLCPQEQLRAVVIRDVYKEFGLVPKAGGQPALMNAIAGKVVKNGGGHPCKEAIRQLLHRVDEDPGWFPGKSDQVKFGPSPVLNGAKRRCVATSAMALKEQDIEPTYATVLAKCPRATVRSAVEVCTCLRRGFSLVPCSPGGARAGAG